MLDGASSADIRDWAAAREAGDGGRSISFFGGDNVSGVDLKGNAKGGGIHPYRGAIHGRR